MGWAICSLSMHLIAVIGTLVTTAFIRDVFKQPIINTVGIGLFLGALLATAKVSYTHGLSQPATSVENVNYVCTQCSNAHGLTGLCLTCRYRFAHGTELVALLPGICHRVALRQLHVLPRQGWHLKRLTTHAVDGQLQ